MTRYLTWPWTSRVHMEAPPDPPPVPSSVPVLPTREEVLAAVTGGSVAMWCGVTTQVRWLGERPHVTEVTDPDPASVCRNCARAKAKGQPVVRRPPKAISRQRDTPEDPRARVVGTKGTGGRYVWRGGRE